VAEVQVLVTTPDGRSKTRAFDTPRQAAQYGVAYYLVDNGLADRKTATRLATEFEKTGTATRDGHTIVALWRDYIAPVTA
jgi:hypothetical protein